MTWTVLKTAVDQWFRHRSARLGAALAYYSVFSMGPLLLIVTSIAGLFFGADAVRGSLTSQFKSLLGETGSKAVEAMLAGASSEQSGMIAGLTGVILLLVAALGVVVQLKDAMNTIWNVEEPKEAGRLVVLAHLPDLVRRHPRPRFPVGGLLGHQRQPRGLLVLVRNRHGLIGEALNFLVSLAILTTLFAMLFKWFPDTEIAWRDVFPGAVATAFLFNVGKFAIGWYIGTQGLEVHLRCRRLDRDPAHLGLLFGADRPVRCRTHPCLRRRGRLPPDGERQ